MRTWKYLIGWGLFWLVGAAIIFAIIGDLLNMQRTFTAFSNFAWGFFCGWATFGLQSPYRKWLEE